MKTKNDAQGDAPVIDLLSVLSQSVEDNNREPVFDEFLQEEEEPAVFDEAGQEYQAAEEQELHQAASAADFMPPEAIAETIVNLLDGMQSSIIPFLREKKIFTEKELEVMQTIDLSGNTVYQPAGSIENMLIVKWKRHQKIVQQIPFDKGERNRMIAATTRYAKDTNMQVSPLAGLMLAYSEVIIKRASYFFNE